MKQPTCIQIIDSEGHKCREPEAALTEGQTWLMGKAIHLCETHKLIAIVNTNQLFGVPTPPNVVRKARQMLIEYNQKHGLPPPPKLK